MPPISSWSPALLQAAMCSTCPRRQSLLLATWSVVIGWQDQLPFPVYLEIHQTRKYLPPTYTGDPTFCFICHFMAGSCHCVKHHNPCVFILLCDWLTAISWHHHIHVFSGSSVIGWQDQPPLPVYPRRMSEQEAPLPLNTQDLPCCFSHHFMAGSHHFQQCHERFPDNTIY